MIQSERRMKMMLTFTLLMIPGALSFSVMGYKGRAVTITCPYDREYTTNKKYFCRHNEDKKETCSDLIKTDIKDGWVKSGRFSLYDNTRASFFNVTITDLNEDDSGTYYCAVDRPAWKDIYTEVKLNVTEEQSFEENTHPSSSSSTTEAPSLTLKPSASDSPSASSHILSKSSLIIIIVCVFVIFTGLLLFILLYCWRRSARDADSDCKVCQSGAGNSELITETTLCYEEIKDIRHQTDSESATITDFNTAPLPTIPSDVPNTVYNTVQLPTIPSDAPNTVYDNPQLPTIPSDSPNTVYDNPQLPTIPSDASKTVYDTVQLPTIPSDNPNTVYSTVQ